MQNPPGLKGIHVSMKSGMLAAQACIHALEKDSFGRSTLEYYPQLVETSWIKKEMYEGRNFSQALSKKLPLKLIHLSAQYLTDGKGLRDKMPAKEDCKTFSAAKENQPRAGADKNAMDGELYADKLTGVYLSKTMHREDQPSHIIIRDPSLCINECYDTYKSPCTRFCPGSVYEIEKDETGSQMRLKLNPSNCLHCKTCDIKDPYKNITWTCPEGGEGPGYSIL
jgi:electron-transferring-flavoprotein dehydrogenase